MRSIRLRLTVGTIMVNAAKNSHPDSRFEVITPTLVAGVRGTTFGTKVDSSGKTALLTTEGSVVVCLQRSGEELKKRLRKSATECELTGATLLVATLSRLSRDVAFLELVKTRCASGAFRFCCCDMPEADSFMLGIMAQVAQYEREQISARTSAALQAARHGLTPNWV